MLCSTSQNNFYKNSNKSNLDLKPSNENSINNDHLKFRPINKEKEISSFNSKFKTTNELNQCK